jgi:hypothetical protein
MRRVREREGVEGGGGGAYNGRGRGGGVADSNIEDMRGVANNIFVLAILKQI